MELRVRLPGAGGSADARRAVVILTRVLTVLSAMEDALAQAPSGRQSGETTWAFTRLALGSVDTVLAPSVPRRGSTSDVLDAVMDRVVEGFEAAEGRAGVPEGWDRRAAVKAAELADMLGLRPDVGMELELLLAGESVRQVTVTRRAAEHLRAGLRVRQRSIGSVTGQLETITEHGGFKAKIGRAHV